MGVSQLIAGLKDQQVTKSDLSDLPRKLVVPPGVTKKLRNMGILAVRDQDKNGTIWKEGPRYPGFMKCWREK